MLSIAQLSLGRKRRDLIWFPIPCKLKTRRQFCSLGWVAVADQSKTDVNDVPLLPCLQVNQVHEDSQVRKLPGDVTGVHCSLFVYMTAPPFCVPCRRTR